MLLTDKVFYELTEQENGENILDTKENDNRFFEFLGKYVPKDFQINEQADVELIDLICAERKVAFFKGFEMAILLNKELNQ